MKRTGEDGREVEVGKKERGGGGGASEGREGAASAGSGRDGMSRHLQYACACSRLRGPLSALAMRKQGRETLSVAGEF